MPFVYAFIGIVALFLLWTAVGTIRRLNAVKRAVADLPPKAGQQFQFWNDQYHRAYALEGYRREARVSRAKMLVVLCSGQPIGETSSGEVGLLLQPGYVETLPDNELDGLIEELEAENKYKDVIPRRVGA